MSRRNPADLVCDLLGVRAIGRALKLSPGSVSKWRESGFIPSKHHQRLIDVANEQRKKLTAEMLVYGERE